MGKYDNSWSLRWAAGGLLSLASMGSAAISLKDISPLGATSLPLGCVILYNSQITSCTRAELSARSCSIACTTYLRALQSSLGEICGTSPVDEDSLLGKALSGQLVKALCQQGRPAVFIPTSSAASPSSSTVNEESSTTTSAASSTTTSDAEPSSSDTPPDPTTLQPVVSQTIAQPTSSEPTQTAAANAPQQTSSSVAEPKENSGKGTGSPFDVPVRSDARRFIDGGSNTISIAALVLSSLLLAR
ncbi:hypothetical protein B0T17DRAFT_278988 [Bombardia bombarda]|uniref:Uncharacterized protein n=1 Tax=Bombardia bombarda TaxID=252184 RepID=A0AA40C0U4_9PEZI|nr:hypothetical protein B0T17DRAFT_278988 [Bombardia bombarda]